VIIEFVRDQARKKLRETKSSRYSAVKVECAMARRNRVRQRCLPFFSQEKATGPKFVSPTNVKVRYIFSLNFTDGSNELEAQITCMFSSGTKAPNSDQR
jgi:hypothetical protein